MKSLKFVFVVSIVLVLLSFCGSASAQNCNVVTVSPGFLEFPSSGGVGSISVNVDFGCGWSASCSGFAISSGGGGGSGPGSFNVFANSNPGPGAISGGCTVVSGLSGSAMASVIVDPPNGNPGGPTGLAAVLQYQAQNSAIGHVIGQAASGGAWIVNFPGSQNWLSYGPYVTIPTAGDYVAAWSLSTSNDTSAVAMGNIDVNDATTQTEIATRQPLLKEWTATNTYQTKTLPFSIDSTRAGHQFEFRVFWFDAATIGEQVLGYVPLQWNAQNPALGHQIGRADGTGWSASVFDGQGWMQYGPYTVLSSAGNYIALWTLQVDNNTNDNNAVAIVDVNDATTQTRLTSLQIPRRQFTGVHVNQVFQLQFNIDSTRAGHAFEFRIWYTAVSYVREQAVGVVSTP